jgi:hypothetical protein
MLRPRIANVWSGFLTSAGRSHPSEIQQDAVARHCSSRLLGVADDQRHGEYSLHGKSHQFAFRALRVA